MSDELENLNEDPKENSESEELEENNSEEGKPAPKKEEKKEKMTEKEKKSSLSDKEAELLKEVMDKKKTIRELENRLKEFEEKFSDLDPDEAREALKARKEAEKRELEKKGEYDRLVKMMREEHDKELQKFRSDLEKLSKELEERDRLINDLTIGNAFSQSSFIRDKMILTPQKVRVLYGEYFDVQDGRVVAFDSPRGSENRTMLVDARGNPLPFDEALKRIVENDPDKERLLKANLSTGAGSSTANVKASPQNKSPLEKITDGLKNIKPGTIAV